MIQTTYTKARANFRTLLNVVEDDCETVIITRKGHGNVVLILTSEFENLHKTIQDTKKSLLPENLL